MKDILLYGHRSFEIRDFDFGFFKLGVLIFAVMCRIKAVEYILTVLVPFSRLCHTMKILLTVISLKDR